MQTVLILCCNNFLLLLQTFPIIVHYRAICLWDRELFLLHNIKSCQFKQESNFSCQTNRKKYARDIMYETVWCSNILSEKQKLYLLNHYQIQLNPLYYQTFNEPLKQKVDITNKLCTLHWIKWWCCFICALLQEEKYLKTKEEEEFNYNELVGWIRCMWYISVTYTCFLFS